MGNSGQKTIAKVAASGRKNQGSDSIVKSCLKKSKWLLGASAFAASTAAMAAPLVINNVGGPTVSGTGQGKRAIWTNGGTVNGQNVDIVAVITTATLNHTLGTTAGRPQVTSVGQDKMFVEWSLYVAGTYVIATGNGGVPVNADVHVQYNDIDGPNNEEVYLPLCSGAIKWIRIDSSATTIRAFGTVSGRAETFSLIGDKSYNNEAVSGVEALYPNTSKFSMGHTGNSGFLVRLDNPTYTSTQTFDYQCADFAAPVAVNDSKEGTPGSPTTINILNNDTIATKNSNVPNNNSQLPSEYALQSVSLVAPAGATGVVTDAKGRTTGFTVPGEGAWAYDPITGELKFTPEPSFKGYATTIDYTFKNALGVASNAATVTVWYPAIGVTKSSTFNDSNADGYGQVGETIDYIYQVKAYGAEPLQNISVTETGFTGAGTLPTPVYQSGDNNTDTKLDLTETWTFKATYALVADDLTAGTVSNSATGKGQTAAGTGVSDTSDSSNPADGTGTSGPGPNNGDPTKTPLAKAPITATNDTQPNPIFAGTAAVNAFNVLGNDTLKTVTATPAAVTLSVVTAAANAGVTLDPATGNVSVAAGTPAGTYTIDYKICEIGNPTNCADAKATVVVTAVTAITATPDAPAPVDSVAGGTDIINALTNDKLNGVDVAIGDVNLTVTIPASNPGVKLDAATGNVSVAPGTPAGTYTIDYQICEKANTSNCADSKVTVVVRNALAVSDDSGAPVNGATGNPSAFNAFTNDMLNGSPVVAANLNTTITSPATPLIAGKPVPELDPATGNVSVPAGTPAGEYTIGYQICEKADPTNCKTATITVKVLAAPIAANDDTPAPVSSLTGGTDIINAFANDKLNGVSIVPGTVTATITTPASNTGVTLDPVTGQVSVAPGTPVGNYTINYTLCEKLNPTNCKDATITVDVVAAPVAATPDTVTGINGVTGNPSALNVLAGDTINSAPASLSNSTLSVAPGSTVPAQLTFNPATGVVGVKPGTPAGTYSFDYQICETLNPTNCKTATASVTVDAAPIVATNDTASGINGAAGATAVANAFTSDTINGSAASPTNATLAVKAGTTVPAGLTFNTATGSVDVAAGTPAGSYVINYTLCEKLNPTNCKDATITVDVVAAAISAAPDEPAAVIGAVGANDIINAFANDKLNGVAVDPAKITATVTSPAMPGALVPLLDPVTGFVDVPAGTPASTYTINYTICEKLNPANCADSFVTVVVQPAPIVATNDTATGINGTAGATAVANAFTSDTVNSVAASPSNATVKVKAGTTVPAGLKFNPATGSVDVAAGTPAGSYVINYTICETLNPTNCKDATITVGVIGAPIAATPDTPPAVNGAAGNPSVINAFTNDKLNGVAVTPDTVKATIKTPASNPGVVLDPATGSVSVAPGTPAGSYTITYEICEKLNPSNCATSTVTVVVDPAPIVATNDTASGINGTTGATAVANAFTSDTINGAAASPTNATITVKTGTTVPAGLTFNPATGSVDVAAGTPAGSYVINYTLCEKLNPANCKDATITVDVVAAPVAAANDTPAPVNGAAGNPSVVNVFTNDTLNGAPADPANITTTITAPASNSGVKLDPATGIVSVAPGTPAGAYTIKYKICETLNPTNCADASVNIVVQPPVIAAAVDTPVPVRQGVGNPALINAFANDTLNGVPVDPAMITATITAPASNPGVVLDPATGNVSVGKDVPAGTYTIEYQICEKLNPANCATSKVTVVVELPISAVTGTVFTDTNSDGKLDPGEERRAGWVVEITRNGAVVAATTTDAQGNYRIEGLTSGPGYEIVFRSPENNVVYNKIKNVTLSPNTTVIDQNQPIDPSGVFFDAVTRLPISGVSARLADANGVPLPVVCFVDASQANQTTGATGEYRFDIVPGAAPQCPVGETIYRIIATPPAGYSATSTVLLPQANPLDPTGLPGPVRVTSSPVAPTGSNPIYYTSFRLASGDPNIVNNHIALDPFLIRTPLIVTKTSIKRAASVGDIVPYEITVRNTENSQRSGVTIVDILPPGLKYVAGSSSVDGAALEPVTSDRELSWSGQIIPANGSRRYNLTLIVGAGVTGGEKVNTGVAENAAGIPISNRGTAVISITPNAVFDCSELLGKVFEDANRNGYQDAGEPGVPGTRLATVNGQLITTDEFGRYHIACAAVPDARIGSNFVLKVDTRSLPLGWDTTTDNPRSIRLTRGKFGELNFGVAPKEDSSNSPGEPSAKRNEKGE